MMMDQKDPMEMIISWWCCLKCNRPKARVVPRSIKSWWFPSQRRFGNCSQFKWINFFRIVLAFGVMSSFGSV
jgi:hypothetical protein